MKPVKNTLVIEASVIVLVAVCAGAYLGYWWLTRDVTDRQARVNQQTYGRQNALVEQILDDIREAEAPATPPEQRVAIVNIVCDSYYKLTGSIQLPPSAQAFITKECIKP